MKRMSRISLCVVLCALANLAMAAQTIKSISVRGNKEMNEVAIKAIMKSKEGQILVLENLKKDEDAILSLGYFKDVKVLTRVLSDAEVELTVDVSEYAMIKEFRIIGNKAIPLAQIQKVVQDNQPLGKIWNNRNATPIVQGIRDLYAKKGFEVNFDQLGPQTDSPGTLTVSIIETVVGKIILNGLTRTKPETIRRIMKVKPGDAYNDQLVGQDLQELFSTSWFEDMKPSKAQGEKPEQIDIKVDFKEARTAQINAGVALDPQSRLVGTLSYNDSNFKGLGQSLGIQLSQATAGGGPSADFAFTNRFYDSKDTVLRFSLYSKVVYNFTGSGLLVDNSSGTTDSFDERRNGIGISFTRPLGHSYKGTFGFVAREARTINLNTSTSGTSNFIQQDGNLGNLQFGLEWDTSRPSTEPLHGQAYRVLLEPGVSQIRKIGGTLAGSTGLIGRSNFVRGTFEYRRYSSRDPILTAKDKAKGIESVLAKSRPVVAFRVQASAISGTVPFFDQLFVGGSDSLRGYPNQRFWGSQSMLATLEYRVPIQKSFNLTLFADFGGAWGGYGSLNGFGQSGKPSFHLGFGPGLSFRTPLGPIRVDLGFGEGGKARTHFSFGTSF